MAAISFPREFHHGLPLAGFSFPLEQMVEVTPLRSGKQIVADLGPSLWRPSFRSTEMDGEDAGAARAWYASLLSTGSFYAYDKLRQYPVSYTSGFAGLTVGGNPFTGYGTIASLAANKVELALSQLPVGFKLRPGDFLAFDYSSAAALTNTPRFQVDNLYSVAFPHRVVSSYTGYTIRARRGSDNAEKDFLPNAAGWLESAQLLAWSPGDTFYWVTAYDQSGSNRPWTQSTAGLQPKLITSGAYVYADASDTDRRLVLQNGSDFAQNISSFSYVAIATAESGISANAAVVKIAANVASASRSLIRYRVADNMWEFAGRRLDADSLVVAGSISTALGSWNVLQAAIRHSDTNFWHRVDGTEASNSAFGTSGSTENTASASIEFGAFSSGGTGFRGKLMGVALIRDLINSPERDTIATDFALLKPANWPSALPDARALHMVVQGGDADGSGNLTVEVRPYVRPGYTLHALVHLYRPACRALILPGSYREEFTPPDRYQFSFEAIQTL